MTWPFPTPKNEPEVKTEGDSKPPEKTPAELIAETVQAALKPFLDGEEARNKRLEAIEQGVKRPEPKPHVEPNEPVSVLDDEDMAFTQRMTPIFQRQLELESRVVKNDIKAEYVAAGFGDLWAQYENDINAILDGSPLVTADRKVQRGDPQYIRNVVDMVFGRAARKAGMRFDGKNKGFFLESASGGEHTNTPVSDGLSDNQRRVMSRMGIPLDKAKDVLKKLQFVQ